MAGAGPMLEDLPWLPPPPDGFGGLCREAGSADTLKRLARHRLSLNQLFTLAGAWRRLDVDSRAAAGLRALHVGIIGGATMVLLPDALAASGLRRGLELSVDITPFGQFAQSTLAMPAAWARPADIVILMLDQAALPWCSPVARPDSPVEEAIASVRAAIDDVRAWHQGPLVVTTLAAPAVPFLGSADLADATSPLVTRREVNRVLGALAAAGDIQLLDLAGLAAAVGGERWHDEAAWATGKLAVAPRHVPLFCDVVARLLAAMVGRMGKALVLDLDNTLWGGVVGDDGVEGLVLGPGDPAGESFAAMQHVVRDLRDRGIVLAIASKNDHAIALDAIANHPEMVLREPDFAVIRANWNDKAGNIREIATELELGLESLVFVDDNPVERAFVRDRLPEVNVVELPDDPALFARTLLWSGAFESLGLTEADRKRADQYRANVARRTLSRSTVSIDDFLVTLEMKAEVGPFRSVDLKRIAQLLQRSNQFNLTTRRRSEQEVAAVMGDPGFWTLQVRLADRFGDNGLISLVICAAQGNTWRIDTWVMSCRVLGRRVEDLVLDRILAGCKAADADTLEGVYIPTPRNGLVADHYRALGFAPADAACQGQSLAEEAQVWRLPVASSAPRTPPITVVETA